MGFFGQYPSSGGSSSGVISLNSLTGALTLVPGAGITITPSGSSIIIASSDLMTAITSINGDTTTAQLITTASTGTDFTITTTSGDTIVAIPTASSINRGLLSPTDWNTFNSKQDALTFGSISTSTSGITVGNGPDATVGPDVTIDIQNATTSQNGLLTSTDWNTFNSKQSTLTFSDSLVNTAGTVTLVNDTSSPGASMYYGTNASSILGYFTLPTSPSGSSTIDSAQAVGNINVLITNPGTAVFDGVTLNSGQQVLLINQGTRSQNGLWVFNGSSSALTRPSGNWNSGSTVTPNNLIAIVAGGLRYGSSIWQVSDTSDIVDTSIINLQENGFNPSNTPSSLVPYQRFVSALGAGGFEWQSLFTNVIAMTDSSSPFNAINILTPALPSGYNLTLPNIQGTAGSNLQNDGSGNLSWQPTGVPFDFGPGTDGAAVLDGTSTFPFAILVGSTYTLTTQVYLTDLTINSGITLIPQGYSIFGNGTLTNNGNINMDGSAGGAGGIGGQGTGGTAGASYVFPNNPIYTNLGFGNIGGLGGTGTPSTEGDGQSGNSGILAFNQTMTSSGSGGSGTVGPAGNSAITAVGEITNFKMLTNSLVVPQNTTINVLGGGPSGSGGGAGGGDGTNNGGGGGGGGGSGSVIGIWFKIFNNLGTISSQGGAGGNGESPTTFVPVTGGVGGGGGGSGGGGGFIYIVSNTTPSVGTITVAGGIGGTGGTAAGVSSAPGTAGSTGGIGLVLHYQTSTGTWI